ncbi:N-acetylglucosamine kinase [Terrilactibacillus laevilacticus]|uniref:N-acetylglucosamine kinase n=1 Tax=Terrilactibacillus laevilacticus TaxID=1380157 RepID=A0ABW5PKW5_9BACI|nr:BadF/BadG/BcrA/BcrD ATPase family protein [Terrilactibacillus laevilacticus]
MLRYYIGIDGGGTKTDAVLFSSDGQLINRVIGAGTNPNSIDHGQLIGYFKNIFLELIDIKYANIKITGCFAGLSGSDHPSLTKKLFNCINKSCPVPIEHLIVGNDAMNALWSGTDGEPGLVVIAGTGSIAYGVRKNGDHFRIGGWGYLFGDEGSGYDIGRETIRRVMMSYDGREQKTQLTSMLKEYFKVEQINDIIPIIYRTSKNVIAGLVPHVEKCALNGDELANKILSNAAQSLILLINCGINRLLSEDTRIVLTGGVWKSLIIRETVCRSIPHPLIFPVCAPVYGSIAKCFIEWEEKSTKKFFENIKVRLM